MLPFGGRGFSHFKRRFGFGRLGIMADIKYRYVKWKMGRLRKKFDVYQGGQDSDWDKKVH